VGDEVLVAFGQRLATVRRNAGFSQEALAAKAGIHRTYIGGVERGERNISLRNIQKLAEALGVDASALFIGGAGR